MVTRDRPIGDHIGFGVSAASLPKIYEDRSVGDDQGGVARYFEDKPILKFFAATTATMVGAVVAGAGLKKVGTKTIASAARQRNTRVSAIYDKSLPTYRKVQKVLDEYSAAERTIYDRRDITRDVTEYRGFLQSEEERQRMISMGLDAPEVHDLRAEMQQRLVKLGRRLPYEIPAAYATDTIVFDHLLGDENPDRNVSPLNPVDFIGDFANETMKYLAMAFVPFEGMQGAAKHGWNQSLYRAASSNSTNMYAANQSIAVDINNTLSLIGHSFSDLMSRSSHHMGQASGAFSQTLVDVSQKTRSAVSHMNMIAKSNRDDIAQTHRFSKDNPEAPTVLHQTYQFFTGFNRRMKNAAARGPARATGSSRLERYAFSLNRLAPEYGKDGAMTGGGFYQQQVRRHHAQILRDKLVNKHGIDANAADRLVSEASYQVISPNSDMAFSQRFRFGDDGGRGANATAEYINDLFGLGGRQGVGNSLIQDGRNVLEESLRAADFEIDLLKPQIQAEVGAGWRQLTHTTMVDNIYGGLGGGRRAAYSDFTGRITPEAREFLIRKTAQRKKLDTIGKSLVEVESDLRRKRGFDPKNITKMRGYLMDKGDVSKPWQARGFNLFGMRAVSVDEALESGYFNESPYERQIRGISYRAKDRLGRYQGAQMKVGGLYRLESTGEMVDFNPIFAGARRMLDSLGNELKIPFIQVKPLQLSQSYKSFQSGYQQGPIRFTAGLDTPFLLDDAGEAFGRAGKAKSDGFFFFEKRFGFGRGHIEAFDKATGTTKRLPGTFSTIAPSSFSSIGRLVMHGQDEALTVPHKQYSDRMNWLRKKFSVSADQPNSLLRRVADFRFRGRGRGRFSDPYAGKSGLANLLANGSREELDAYVNNATSKEMLDFLDMMRNQSMSPKIPRGLADDALLSRVHQSRRVKPNRPLHELTPEQLRAEGKQLLDELDVVGPDAKKISDGVRNARKRLLEKYDPNRRMDLRTSTQAVERADDVATHADKLRADLVRVRAVEEALSARNFDDFMGTALDELDSLVNRGFISSEERAKAALSIAGIRQSYNPRNQRLEVFDEIKRSIRAYRSQPDTPQENMRRVLQMYADRQDLGLLGHIARRFDFAPDTRAGVRNIFSDNFQLVPSFTTTLARNPLKAISSVIGVNAWGRGNASAFSTATMTSSYLTTRMNRLMGNFGGMLEPSDFTSGPMELMLKGMIGKRILPATIAGAAFMGVDRTLGGYALNERDINNERIYQPFFLGGLAEIGVRAQALGSGVMPGGPGYGERLEELTEGEVAVRRGRYWLLGNTPWMGAGVDHYRPSWYRMLKSGYEYTDQMHGTPMERLAFGYDFSPLRPLDPYRFERRTAEDRPYPRSGDYFTGPYGPITPLLNATIGKLLKPRIEMNPEQMQSSMGMMGDVGQSGQSPPAWQQYADAAQTPGPGTYIAGNEAVSRRLGLINNRYLQAAAGDYSTSLRTPMPLMGSNESEPAQVSPGRASPDVRMGYSPDVLRYLEAAGTPKFSGSGAAAQMTMYGAGLNSREVYARGAPVEAGSVQDQASELAYRMQEFSGIYGFMFGSTREALGLGTMDYESMRPTMATPSDAYGSSRSFWDLNLGGLGDAPTPIEGQYANLEFSEIVRRFIPRPRERAFNPLPNSMNIKAPWLPGSDYLTDFKTGDPYTKVQLGEMRLPGKGYERLHGLSSDRSGRYGAMDRLRILADVAPYSPEFRRARAEVSGNLTAAQADEYRELMRQVEEQQKRHRFTNYTDYEGPMEGVLGPLHALGQRAAHMDNFFTRKFVGDYTAVEHHERQQIYGSTFPEWATPMESFIEPAFYKAGDRNPLTAAAAMGFMGYAIGATPRMKGAGKTLGAITGLGVSLFQNAKEAITGERYVPEERKKQIRFEEYFDVMKYIKASRNFQIARQSGDGMMAEQFKRDIKSTMYGADLYGSTAEELSYAVPKRKREHFMEFVTEEDPEVRERILSTAGVLERRLYQAAWGQNVEARPEIEEYMEDHELPDANWSGWSPNVNMDDVMLKSMQREGLNASQMGYYPQEVQRANLMNPSYPEFSDGSQQDVAAVLRLLLESRGISGSVSARPGFGSMGQVFLTSGIG